MDMPKPGDAHKKLSALIGEWSGTEKLHPSPWDPAGGTAEARVINRWVADGFAVVQEYEQSRNGQVTFRGHGVFWFDPQRDEYVMHWWDARAARPANSAAVSTETSSPSRPRCRRAVTRGRRGR